MKGINKVFVVGTLGKDPETRYMPSGDAITTLSVATSESWKDKSTGGKKERTEWHKVVLYARQAEVAQKYLEKGSKVYIEGALRTRKWQGQDGQDRYSTEIVARDMQMLGDTGSRSTEAPAMPERKVQHAQQAQDDFDDQEIPF